MESFLSLECAWFTGSGIGKDIRKEKIPYSLYGYDGNWENVVLSQFSQFIFFLNQSHQTISLHFFTSTNNPIDNIPPNFYVNILSTNPLTIPLHIFR